jgi:hypothetical protein
MKKQFSSKNPANVMIVMGGVWILLSIALLYYQYTRPTTIEIEWETATEVATAGFNLYRSQMENGDFTQINERMIPSQGTAVSGAIYTYEDDNVTAGETYYYLLEEIELTATTRRYEDDKFSYTVPKITFWIVLLTAVIMLVGLALIITGIRDLRD